MRALLDYGVDVRTLVLDTMIAAYLLDPAESRYVLEELLDRYAQARLPDGAGAAEGQLDFDDSTVPPSAGGRPARPRGGATGRTAVGRARRARAHAR